MLTNLKNNKNFKRISSVILTLVMVLTINGTISFASDDNNRASSTLMIPINTPPIDKASSTLMIPINTPPIDKASSTLMIPINTPHP